MLIRKYDPVFAPDTGTGADAPADGGAPPRVPQGGDQPQGDQGGPGSGRTSVRKSLEKTFRDAEKTEQKEQAGRTKDGKYVSQKQRQDQEEEPEEREEQVEGQEQEPEVQAQEQEQPEVGEQEEQPQPGTAEPPKAWTKEAKADWAKLPQHVQAAVLKREDDMARGVQALKKGYAEIDQALQPRLEMIKNHGHTPAQAVNQLFAWFEAINMDTQRVKQGQPPVAAIALLQSFGIDPRSVAAAFQQPGQEQEQEEPVELTPVEKELAAVKEQLAGLTNTWDNQRQHQTLEILQQWSQGKPYFEEVRPMMAHLLQSGAVPPLPGNRADLDKAYDMALYAIPEVRAKILADQRKKEETDRAAVAAKEKKAQQEQAEKARRASGGLGPSAPGNDPGPSAKGKKGSGTSVRDSLKAAMKELTD